MLKFYCSIIVIALLIVSGCSVGPDYIRPDTAAKSADGFFNQADYIGDVNDFRWWRNFADPITNDLVERTLANNYELKAAASRVLQAQASFEESSGKLLPAINYGLSRDRSKTVTTVAGMRQENLSTNYLQALSISYTLDLFGKLRHAEKAAWNDMLSEQANQQALTNALIASAVNARIQIATQQRQLDIVRETIKSRHRTLEIIERRYRNGRVSSVDVRLARENLAAAQAVEPTTVLALAISHHGLDILLGQRPGLSEHLDRTLPNLPSLLPVPAGIPASLLDRRPDLVAAEAKLKSQNQRVGVSIAQLYPDFTLTGTYGFRSEHFDNVFNDDFEIYSLVLQASQPIWRGGQLRAQVKGAKAKYQEAAYNYANAVLVAMKEVEDALVSDQQFQRQYEYQQISFEQAKKAQELSLERYQQGLEPLLTFLEAERRRINSENNLTLLKSQLWTNRVNLFLALGGNWTGEVRSEKIKVRSKK